MAKVSTEKLKTDDTLLTIAERCEAAAGPARDLDADIGEAVTGWERPSGGVWQTTPHYTASLGAAMTLVPEGWAVQIVRTANGKRGGANLYLFSDPSTQEPSGRQQGSAETPALALCAAALRARAA